MRSRPHRPRRPLAPRTTAKCPRARPGVTARAPDTARSVSSRTSRAQTRGPVVAAAVGTRGRRGLRRFSGAQSRRRRSTSSSSCTSQRSSTTSASTTGPQCLPASSPTRCVCACVWSALVLCCVCVCVRGVMCACVCTFSDSLRPLGALLAEMTCADVGLVAERPCAQVRATHAKPIPSTRSWRETSARFGNIAHHGSRSPRRCIHAQTKRKTNKQPNKRETSCDPSLVSRRGKSAQFCIAHQCSRSPARCTHTHSNNPKKTHTQARLRRIYDLSLIHI